MKAARDIQLVLSTEWLNTDGMSNLEQGNEINIDEYEKIVKLAGANFLNRTCRSSAESEQHEPEAVS